MYEADHIAVKKWEMFLITKLQGMDVYKYLSVIYGRYALLDTGNRYAMLVDHCKYINCFTDEALSPEWRVYTREHIYWFPRSGSLIHMFKPSATSYPIGPESHMWRVFCTNMVEKLK